jgi:hypothetical protein
MEKIPLNNKKRNSIFDEIKDFIPVNNKKMIIESRASHAIYSLVNILNLIEENYEKPEQIKSKLLLAIKNKEPDKFLKKLKKSSLKINK